MPFLAMKIDSSLPDIKDTLARKTKNGAFTKNIWTILWYNEVRKRRFGLLSVSLVSYMCQGDTNRTKLMQANANIPLLNALGIPRSYSLASNTISIISTPSNRSTFIDKYNLETISVLCESSRSPVFSNNSSRSGVMHSIAFNTFRLKSSVLLILSPSINTTIAMFTTKATIYRPQIRKSQPRYSDFKHKHTIQAATAGPKVKAIQYQLELPSYFAR